MIYSLNENVKYMRSIQSPYDARKRSYASDNPFESLALTNPELFNRAKLQALEDSKNLVRDFDSYFGAILDADNARFRDFSKDKGENWTDKDIDNYQNFFNVSIHSAMYSDFEGLKQTTGLSDNIINRMIYKAYIPDSLTEEGCKKLIDIRLKQSQILVDSLYKMLEMNYIMLSLDAGQATDLSKDLKDPNKSNKAIEEIKAILSSNMDKFRMGLSNYDFRPLGGACVFIATGLDLASTNPLKYVANLFKYDAIVFGHGEYSKNERPYTPLAIWIRSIRDVVKKIHAYTNGILKLTKEYENIISDSLKNEVQTLRSYSAILATKKIDDKDIIEFRKKIEHILNELINESTLIGEAEERRKLVRYIDMIDYAYQPIISKMDIDQARMDGKSATWVVQPISTLKHQNLTHIIDIVRALKEEGFKNILINCCNPGGVKLPKDIINDPSITITMGKYSVLKEDTDLGLNEASSGDIKTIFKKSIAMMKEAISRIVNNCHHMKQKVSKLIKSVKNSRLKDIKITYIKMSGTHAKMVEGIWTSSSILEKEINKSNDTIIDLIETRLRDDTKYINELEQIVFKKPMSESFFSVLEFK